MALLRNSALTMSMLVGSFGMSAHAAGVQGQFTLPFDAQWGNVSLKAGDYTMSVAIMSAWPQVITVTGNGRTVYVLAGNEGIEPLSEKSYLRIVNVNGIHVVREYRSGNGGKSFSFGIPKQIRMQMETVKSPATNVVVMIRH